MATQKPLARMLDEIYAHISKHQETLEFNKRLYKINEGQLKPEIEDSLRKEILSPSALRRALQRIPSINVLKKAVNKLSKVYSEGASRNAQNDTDQDIMDGIVKTSHLDSVMIEANRMLNLSRMAAVEPYTENGKARFRVLAGHQFLPYSDDPTNPMNMTVFIKLMGTDIKRLNRIDVDGRVMDEEEIREVNVFALYSDDEFLVIDSEKSIRTDLMSSMGGASGTNDFGVIPFVYINGSNFELVPYPNVEGLDVSITVPKLLTDLNYAVQFMSHSIIWTKNSNLDGAEMNPDSLVNLGDGNTDIGQPEIGTIDPKVDVERVLQLIEFQMGGYFSSVGIKTSTVGSMMPGREASGLAKAMDEGDTTAERRIQTEKFRSVEGRLWEKMISIQDFWARNNLTNDNRTFTRTFPEEFAIIYGETKPLETESEKVARLKVMKDMGAITLRQIVRTLNPDFSEDQVAAWVAEIKKENEENIESMMPRLAAVENSEEEEPSA